MVSRSTLLSLIATAGILALGLGSGPACAQTVGYFTDFVPGNTGPVAPIAANGLTPVAIADIATFDFSTVSIVMIDESDNSGISTDLSGRIGDLATFAQNGGVVVIHDRSAGNAGSSIIPGGSGILLARDTAEDVDVATPGNPIVNGPFGTIDDTTLDNGGSSIHGYAYGATLPAGTTSFLTDPAGLAGNSAAFSFGLGSGLVYYSTIPLDYYLDGSSNPASNAAFGGIYAPNVLAYAKSFKAGPTPSVPEPGSLAMLTGFVVTGAAAWRRRRAR